MYAETESKTAPLFELGRSRTTCHQSNRKQEGENANTTCREKDYTALVQERNEKRYFDFISRNK